MRKWPDPDYHIAQTCKVKLTGRLNPARKRESWLIEDVASRHPHPSSPPILPPGIRAVYARIVFSIRVGTLNGSSSIVFQSTPKRFETFKRANARERIYRQALFVDDAAATCSSAFSISISREEGKNGEKAHNIPYI